MDPRLRADETLARARARGAFVVTPDNATSPMDAANTVRIPRDIIDGADDVDPDSTVVIPNPSQYDAGPQNSGQQNSGQYDSGHYGTAQYDAAQYGTGQYDAGQYGGWPTTDYGQQEMPPNPYYGQRGPNEFGPLGSQAAQQQFPPPHY